MACCEAGGSKHRGSRGGFSGQAGRECGTIFGSLGYSAMCGRRYGQPLGQTIPRRGLGKVVGDLL